MKTIGGLRKLRHRGGRLVTWIFTFTAAADKIVRMRRLLTPRDDLTAGARGPLMTSPLRVSLPPCLRGPWK